LHTSGVQLRRQLFCLEGNYYVPRLIHWFRRDLRLTDNTALAAALTRAEEVVPVFVLDPVILSRPDTGVPRVAFLCAALAGVDAGCRAQGSRLLIAHGDPEAELPRLCAALGADGVVFNRDDEPFARDRDARVTEILRRDGYSCEGFFDQGLHDSEAIKTPAGDFYHVYTPYRKRAEPNLYGAPPTIQDSAQRLGNLAPARIIPAGEPLPTTESLGFPPPSPEWALGDEDAGRKLLQRFRMRLIAQYANERNTPAADSTSHLSPHLRHGTVSARQCLHAALHAHQQPESRSGAELWISELIWRDFYRMILYHMPHVEHRAAKPVFDDLEYGNDPVLYEAWERGETGYPIVDAAMRQMRTLAWMHNRCRMIVANFLVKDLLCDYKLGERAFMRHLMDGCLAANNGGWQWNASTGTDPQPYFRIFNPLSQSQKSDPNGDYIRRWVPELAKLPREYIHAPHAMPPLIAQQYGFHIGADYPLPIVDHATQRDRALAMYRKVIGKTPN